MKLYVLLTALYCAGVPGLEPRLTEPESAGLPITPYPTIYLNVRAWRREVEVYPKN